MKKLNDIALSSIVPLLIFTSSMHAKEVNNLNTIIVTANKVEDNIQDIPQSITIIDEILIENKGIQNIADVIKEVPNMSATYGIPMGVNFRGLNASLFTMNNPVVIYIDGIPTSGRYGFDASMANVKRIEVLRGPQGTLYGKDAIGAIINIITKEPTNQTTGKIDLGYGSDNYMKGTFNINSPLVKDKLYFGVNAQISQDDGWITNDYTNNDKAAKDKDQKISTYLIYNINDKLNAKLVLNHHKLNTNWKNGYGLLGGTDLEAFKRDDAKHVSFDIPEFEEVITNSQSLHIKYSFDNCKLNAVTTHTDKTIDDLFDLDSSDNAIYNELSMYGKTDIKALTQEIRLSSKNRDVFRWIGGLYFDKDERRQDPYGMAFPNYDMTTNDFIGNFYMNADSQVKSTTVAIFGQAMIPFNDKIELTLGGRYQKIKKEISSKTYYLPINIIGDPYYTLNDEKTWNTFLPKVALSYKVHNNLSSYLSISKGYMPGGYNYFSTNGTVDDNDFEPQQSTNYEAGIKGVVNNISFSTAIFRMDIKDIHLYKYNGITSITDNADKAHSQGLEFEVNYFPSDYLEISTSIGLIDSKYDDYDSGTKKFDGEKIEKTPAYTANLSIVYAHPKGFYGRADIKNKGDMYFYDGVNQKFAKASAYTIADLKVGYKFSYLDLDLYGYVNNLTDEEYITTFASDFRKSVATFGDPKRVGFGARYKF